MDDGTGQTPENSNPSNNAGDDELTRLRKERDQERMRANQLKNELDAKAKADEEAHQAKLKENEEFRALYEQETAKRKELEDKLSAEARAAQVRTATEEIRKDFSKELLDVADTAGLVLADASDEAKAAYKEKLDALASKVTPSTTKSPVRANNAPQPERPAGARSEVLTAMRVGSGVDNPQMLSGAMHEYLKDNPALEEMRRQSGYRR